MSWIGDLYDCFNFGDVPVPPYISNMIVAPNPVVLNAGTTTVFECNFTVNDNNGANEITGANITVYTNESIGDSAVSNNTKYDNETCIEVAVGTTSRDYTCTVGLLYYAINGTWTCNATGVSIDGNRSNTLTFSVDPIYALNITPSLLDFGDMAAGDTSNNLTANITNVGNRRINVSVYGYGINIGDNNSFNCETQNISLNYTRYASNDTAEYDQKESLTDLPTELRLTMEKQNTTTDVMNVSYWQTHIPLNITDVSLCNGTIIFEASLV